MDVQRAVAGATNYLRALYGGAVDDVLLEEVERTPAGAQWLVTLSFTRPGVVTRDAITKALGLPDTAYRYYKVFTIDDGTGEVTAMKIRQSA